MAEAEFDGVAADYHAQHAASIRLSGESTDYFARYKAQDTSLLARQAGCEVKDLLDFGSGIGNAVAPLRESFPEARLTCLDVSAQSLALSRRQHGEDIHYRAYDGQRVPEDLGAFDAIFTACVFHHIPAGQHIDLLAQLRGHLRPGGLFVLFEHNPWNPLTRHAVATCPFDANAVLISAPEMRRRMLAAGFADCRIRYRIFFPAPAAALRPLERWMTGLPIGAQYSLSAR
jgi:SAM-dependent methyltransferase